MQKSQVNKTKTEEVFVDDPVRRIQVRSRYDFDKPKVELPKLHSKAPLPSLEQCSMILKINSHVEVGEEDANERNASQ